ncbi:2-aminoethanethiol (cysteamine) dioxygenase a [Paramormyrops kingsleyae]|uniref:2-aminoethanethiol (cysteamine) dioxygenase a n=1 Tax=Paramormyrops kingsleyae TaxID=1676925 RepID=UPI000CD65A54|nr:2-aminoethanethiol dioxygenase [Paramormyrops kingsleyae]
MMPRDNTSSLIQRIARQAHVTYKNTGSSASGANNKVFLEDHSKLCNLLNEIKAADLKIAPRKRRSSKSLGSSPPVTYMHICETNGFSMGVFLLKTGSSIPLHDHPGMNGMLKVLYGKVSIRCFDKVDESPAAGTEARFHPPLLPFQRETLRRSVLGSVCEISEDSGPCILTPQKDNLHQIDAVDGPAAFLDILAPPYDSDDGRDCHYYKILRPVLENADEKPEQQEDEMWLLEIPQPGDFWCGSEPYPGPKISI